MSYDPTFQRAARIDAIARWAEEGVLKQRQPLPIERSFMERVRAETNTFFKPIEISDLDSVEFHRQLSYLVDAFDSLPQRVDIAFDSVWKAFELETKEISQDNITDRLKHVAEIVDGAVIDLVCANFPVQSCEYLYKRLISDAKENSIERGLNNRIRSSTDESIRQLLDHLYSVYEEGSAESRRKGALFLRRALRGETLNLGKISDFSLGTISKARILISLFLYTARNERFHGSSFSPFISSAASLRTYTHPFFAFLASYYLLISLWQVKRPQVLVIKQDTVLVSLADNLKTAHKIFGAHWNK